MDGHPQDSIDGTSFVYTLDDAAAPERKTTQYFEIMGSRGIYHEGWMASVFGPRTPWVAGLILLSKSRRSKSTAGASSSGRQDV